MKVSHVSKGDDFLILATNQSWVLLDNEPAERKDFRMLSPGFCFSSIGGGKKTSAGYPKLEAADKWHYEYEGLAHKPLSIGANPEKDKTLFLFSAKHESGASALNGWAEHYDKKHAYFCFAWEAEHDYFMYSTLACSGRCVAPLFCLLPLIPQKTEQLKLEL